MRAIQPIIPCNAAPQAAWNNLAGTTIEHMLVTDYYDGATGGFIQLSAGSPLYHFVTLDWSQSQTIRVIALSLVPADSWAKLTSFFSEKPQRGQWLPKFLQRPSEEELDRIERFLSEIVVRAEPPSVVLAWNISTNEILAARQVGPISPDHLVNLWGERGQRPGSSRHRCLANHGDALGPPIRLMRRLGLGRDSFQVKCVHYRRH